MNAPARRIVERNAGFTLLEVLIGATLLAIMMLLLTSSLRIGAESWDAGEARMAEASRMFVVENFLRSHIGSLLPVGPSQSDGRLLPPLQGGPDDLTYVAPLPEQVKAGGLYRFHLYLAGTGDRKDIRVGIVPYTTGPESKDAPEPLDDLPLLENVKVFRLSYLPKSPQNTVLGPAQSQPAQWTDTWQNQDLPALIRIDIEPEGKGPWPGLTVAPRTQRLQ